jgi:hypothetical protein
MAGKQFTAFGLHLEAGKFKKIDKFKIPNEILLDQGGSTLKSP